MSLKKKKPIVTVSSHKPRFKLLVLFLEATKIQGDRLFAKDRDILWALVRETFSDEVVKTITDSHTEVEKKNPKHSVSCLARIAYERKCF